MSVSAKIEWFCLLARGKPEGRLLKFSGLVEEKFVKKIKHALVYLLVQRFVDRSGSGGGGSGLFEPRLNDRVRKICNSRFYELKGTVQRDFLNLVFYIKRLILVSMKHS